VGGLGLGAEDFEEGNALAGLGFVGTHFDDHFCLLSLRENN
jgi:hypothetical protein